MIKLEKMSLIIGQHSQNKSCILSNNNIAYYVFNEIEPTLREHKAC